MAFGGGFTSAALYQWIPNVEKEGVSQCSGLVACIGAFGGFIIPPLLGYSKHFTENGQAYGMFIFTLISGIGIGLSLHLRNHLEQERIMNEFRLSNNGF